jgi:hypothetical protein
MLKNASLQEEQKNNVFLMSVIVTHKKTQPIGCVFLC